MAKKGPGDILHFNGIRLRATGNGNLKQALKSLQNVDEYIMVDFPLHSATDRELFTLANFKKQRAQFRFGTLVLGETYVISRIRIFARPVESGYPQ